MTGDPQPRSELVSAFGELVLAYSSLEEALRDALFVLTQAEPESTRVFIDDLRYEELVHRFKGLYCVAQGRDSPPPDVTAFLDELLGLGRWFDTCVRWAHATTLPAQERNAYARSGAIKTHTQIPLQRLWPGKLLEIGQLCRSAQDTIWNLVEFGSLAG